LPVLSGPDKIASDFRCFVAAGYGTQAAGFNINMSLKAEGHLIMSTHVKRILALALIAGFGLSLAACETADGFGRDVEKLGKTIQKGAD
tara:strand:+ start:39517 stop:39783 length:267 start_codon:yes stop_codon:yes gene_type:complete